MQTPFATSEMRREAELKCLPQLFLGWLLGTHCSAIGQFFPCPQQQSQKALQMLTQSSFLLLS